MSKQTPTDQGETAAIKDMLVQLLMAVSREATRRDPTFLEPVDESEDPSRHERLRGMLITGLKDKNFIPTLLAYIRGDDLESDR